MPKKNRLSWPQWCHTTRKLLSDIKLPVENVELRMYWDRYWPPLETFEHLARRRNWAQLNKRTAEEIS